jgi:two-component system, LytTR family, response regulator LytT
MTAYSDLTTIREATRLRPVGYLVKPVSPAGLFAAIQTAIESHTQYRSQVPAGGLANAEPDYFFVKAGNRMVRLRWPDVYCLVAGKNYVQIRQAGTGVTYHLRGTLRFVVQQLVPSSLRGLFRQVNRSTYVTPAGERNQATGFG